MSIDVVIGRIERARADPEVEIVERKGIGHPDTICDALAERLSVALSRFYVERFGAILHHNVDKVLLRGGRASAHFGGGEVLEPIDIYLAGRAVTSVGDVVVPVEEIAIETARAWIRQHFHALDPVRHVRIHCLVRSGSMDLKDLFTRRKGGGLPLANDTSIGVGYAPSSPLEVLVLDLERTLNSASFIAEHPGHGEDVKVMAVRRAASLSLTVARAFVAQHVRTLDDYRDEKRLVETHAVRAAPTRWSDVAVSVNAADAADGFSVYLTVTGTSAESGDDGEVGRGNRANGLITPMRPMSLEALCGKNPVSHVGKLYNIVARDIAERVVRELSVEYAECYLVSQIGSPIDQPKLARVLVQGGRDSVTFGRSVEELVRSSLAGLPDLSRRILAGGVTLF